MKVEEVEEEVEERRMSRKLRRMTGERRGVDGGGRTNGSVKTEINGGEQRRVGC